MPPFAATVAAPTTGKAIRKIDPDGRAMRRMEREFQAAVGRALNALRLDLVRGLNDGNVGQLTARLDDEAVTRPFQDAIVRQLQRVALAGSEFGREQVETYVFGTRKAVEVGMWELANNAAAQWAMSYGYELVRGLLQTTRDALQAEVAEYIRNSETIGQLTARIRAGSGFSEERARMIAVTEVTRAYARGNQAAWKASGVIERRRWQTNADEKVCPVCGPLSGQVVGLDEPFPGEIDGPPAHPRCRCWCTPVVDDEAESPTYRTFDSPGAADEWGRQHYGRWQEGVRSSPDDLDAIQGYTSTEYKWINEELRSGVGINAISRQWHARLDDLLARQPLAENTTVYRGLPLSVLGKGEPGKAIGDIITDAGYASTSLTKGMAAKFANWKAEHGGETPLLAEIALPAGMQGAYLEGISSIGGEYEFLVARGTRFRITGTGVESVSIPFGGRVTLTKIFLEAILP